MFQKITQAVLDLLFPLFCAGCKKEGMHMCKKCFKKIHPYPNSEEKYLHLDKLYAGSYYSDKTVQTLIQRCKYQYMQDVSEVLFNILQKNNLEAFLSNIDCITFVPLHRIKYNKRGFNQAQLLAEHISAYYSLPLEHTLKRKRNTKPQAEIQNKNERTKNLTNAFAIKNKCEINEKIILIVDDVFTSGSTMNECAKVLKTAGARKVYGLCVARKKTSN